MTRTIELTIRIDFESDQMTAAEVARKYWLKGLTSPMCQAEVVGIQEIKGKRCTKAWTDALAKKRAAIDAVWPA